MLKLSSILTICLCVSHNLSASAIPDNLDAPIHKTDSTEDSVKPTLGQIKPRSTKSDDSVRKTLPKVQRSGIDETIRPILPKVQRSGVDDSI